MTEPELTSIDAGPQAVIRAEGVTASERYLQRLCEHSFLSLWSYPGVFRDQGREEGRGDGKEVCDLLVVFENHIIIFSDKHCEFRDTGNLGVDWCRWYKKTVLKSAEQVWGAERWIRSFPDRLFLDRRCTVPFPLVLPDFNTTTFHRIVVAHDASRRCRERLGGSGSLMIDSTIIGDNHFKIPFTVGHVDPTKGYVHVLDDTTLEIVMRTLDTISDFVAYLAKKEHLLSGETHVLAAGEEELLARYLTKLNLKGEHDFDFPRNLNCVAIEEGHWTDFSDSRERKAQLDADRVSYAWDALIEKFAANVMAGTQYRASHPKVSDQERSFRFLARENRTRRRMLANALVGLIRGTPSNYKASRIMMPSIPGDPYYIFLLLPHYPSVNEQEYRQVRANLLEAYCKVLKLRFPNAKDIIGIATESGFGSSRSEDLLYFDATEWNEELAADARSLQRDLGIFTNTRVFVTREREYPVRARRTPRRTSVSRNAPCPCKSGKRFKRCCGVGMFGKKRRRQHPRQNEYSQDAPDSPEPLVASEAQTL